MPAIHLPADPNLEQLKAQAKDLLRRVRLGETDLLPEGLPATLSTAQLVVAKDSSRAGDVTAAVEALANAHAVLLGAVLIDGRES